MDIWPKPWVQIWKIWDHYTGSYGIIWDNIPGSYGIIWDDYMGFYGIIFVINSSHRLFMLSIWLLATGDLGITIFTSYLAIIIITVWPVAAWMERRSDRRPTGKSHPWQPRSPLGRGRAVRKISSKECHQLITKMRKILSEQINVGGGVAGYLCGSHSLKDEVKRPEGTSTRSRSQETSFNIQLLEYSKTSPSSSSSSPSSSP